MQNLQQLPSSDFLDAIFGSHGDSQEGGAKDYNKDEGEEEQEEEHEGAGGDFFSPDENWEGENNEDNLDNDSIPQRKQKAVQEHNRKRCRVRACVDDEVQFYFMSPVQRINLLKIQLGTSPKKLASNKDARVHTGKVKLSHFDPATAQLAQAAHCAMRQHIAVTEAFLLPTNKEELAWECIVKAGQKNKDALESLESLEGSSLLKSQLIDYVSA